MLGGHQFYLVFFFLFLQISAAVAVGPHVVAALAMVVDLAEVSLLAEMALILGGGGSSGDHKGGLWFQSQSSLRAYMSSVGRLVGSLGFGVGWLGSGELYASGVIQSWAHLGWHQLFLA